MYSFYRTGRRAISRALLLSIRAGARSAKGLSGVRGGTPFIVLLLLAACGGDGGGDGGGTSVGGGGSAGSAVVLRSLAITPANPTVTLASGLQLHATGSYSDGTARDLTATAFWTTSTSQVAIVAAGGALTAMGNGSVTVTATVDGVAGNATVTVQPAPATLTYLHNFQAGEPGRPGGLLQASDGNFYGPAAFGPNQCRQPNTLPCGSLIKITPTGEATLFHAFGPSSSDGFTPGGLIQGSDAALYGVTANGGAYGAGTVFRITLGGAYSVLYSFGASPVDGIVPTKLIQGRDGNLYGLTASGGANHCDNIPQAGSNCGTLFKLTPGGVETILYSFGASSSDGSEPTGLIEAADGSFYGTTLNGGANACSTQGDTHNCGTVFKVTPDGVETILHSFGASPSDGAGPQGVFLQASDGAFYGATASGGRGGTVFKITPAGQETILYTFGSLSALDGNGPWSLIQARDGNFYGTTSSGGFFNCSSCGTAFRLTLSGVETILYSFGPVNQNPAAPSGLIEGRDGAFYGVTADSGFPTAGSGTVFKLVVN